LCSLIQGEFAKDETRDIHTHTQKGVKAKFSCSI
jgi:hypothetical protein